MARSSRSQQFGGGCWASSNEAARQRPHLLFVRRRKSCLAQPRLHGSGTLRGSPSSPQTSSPTKFHMTSRCEAGAAVKHQPLAPSPDGIFLPAQLLSDHKTQPNKGRTLRKHHEVLSERAAIYHQLFSELTTKRCLLIDIQLKGD